MAEIEPDESFTDRVLAATVGLPRRAWHDRPRPDSLQWWRRLLRRPRFAWEAAYIGALLFLPALGSPARLPLDAPEVTQASRAVMRSGGQILQETAAALTERGKTATRSIRDLQLQTRTVLTATAQSQGRTASAVRRKASSMLDRLMRNLLGNSPVKERQDVPQPQNRQQPPPAPNHRPA